MGSKEAWEFLFVPAQAMPRQRSSYPSAIGRCQGPRRAAQLGAFLCQARGNCDGPLSLVPRRLEECRLRAKEERENPPLLRHLALRLVAPGADLVSVVGPAFAALCGSKAAMFMAPAVPLAADVTGATSNEGFVDLLFPGFATNTFVFTVSMLQILEYTSSLLLGSSYAAPKLCSLYLLGASWGPSIAAGGVWRLFLPMMLHANALHIFFNLFFQMRIGFGMEKQFGRRKFVLLYMFCGFFGNLLSVVADPMKLAVGASTSGFGLLGVWLAEIALTWELLGASRPRISMWLFFMLLSCVMMSTISPNVDFVGHLGGSLGGFLMAVILADMREEHQPSWYLQAKKYAKNGTALMILAGLIKCIALGPDGPIPDCGSIFHPRRLKV